MEIKSQIMVHILLKRFHKGSIQDFNKYFPKEDAKAIANLDIPTKSESDQAVLESTKKQINKIHYSWLVEPLDKLPIELQPFVLGSLNPNQAKGIIHLVHDSLKPIAVPSSMSHFLLDLIYKQLKIKDRIPASFLPKTTLSPLLKLNKTQLVEVINFLGLHDLAQEMRKIVEKNLLKQIYETFSKQQQIYLRSILNQPDKLVVSKLGLKESQLNRDDLRKSIHRRGIVRMAKALSVQHPEFVWHICHILDNGRASIIDKYKRQKEDPRIVEFLSIQINQIIHFLFEKQV